MILHLFCISFGMQAFRTCFYMGNFSETGSPKKHLLWSNDEGMLQMIHDRAGYMSRAEQSKRSDKLTKTYVDSTGRKRCVGIRKKLKQSQILDPYYGISFFLYI